MATPSRLSTLEFNEPGNNPVDFPTYVCARVLAANTAESITVPSGGVYVRLAGNCTFFANPTTTATVPADTDDGTANEIFPVGGAGYEWRKIAPSVTTISVITGDAGGGIVTASFYTV